jgi:hypothetical protein
MHVGIDATQAFAADPTQASSRGWAIGASIILLEDRLCKPKNCKQAERFCRKTRSYLRPTDYAGSACRIMKSSSTHQLETTVSAAVCSDERGQQTCTMTSISVRSASGIEGAQACCPTKRVRCQHAATSSKPDTECERKMRPSTCDQEYRDCAPRHLLIHPPIQGVDNEPRNGLPPESRDPTNPLPPSILLPRHTYRYRPHLLYQPR